MCEHTAVHLGVHVEVVDEVRRHGRGLLGSLMLGHRRLDDLDELVGANGFEARGVGCLARVLLGYVGEVSGLLNAKIGQR